MTEHTSLLFPHWGQVTVEKMMNAELCPFHCRCQEAAVEVAKLRDTVEHYKADAAHDEALINRLRAALEWLRLYVDGQTIYGRGHAKDKIDEALDE
jgi:hypothetical protein